MNAAQISDILTWGTATAYLIAMVAFTINLVTGRGVVASEDEPDEDAAASEQRSQRRRQKSLGIAKSVLILGVLVHIAAVVLRGFAAQRAPWANMYEFTVVGSLVAVLVFVIVAMRRKVWFLGAPVTGVATAAIVLGLTQLHVVADGVQPALQSYWLVLHVGVAVGGTGVFTVGMLFTVLQLLRDSYDNGSTLLRGEGAAGRGKPILKTRLLNLRWLESLPRASTLEVLSFRVNSVAFVLWTFTLISGAIWAEDAWGRFWGWDPKEVWSFVVWIVYAAYLHARATQRWTGRRAGYLVLVGYACVLFNFTGVNLIFNGKHSYSGV
ncbi:cytochrome c-type biogenesis protein CcsB [Micrococcales bacterium KH10]|nr:cytochrome c-type biogenesis protein CcsB [Micrococcales bacterium KH10]